jgi:mitogen-activated protein kinase 1/3
VGLGRAVGSTSPYESGSGKYPYSGYPLQQQIPQAYGYHHQQPGAGQPQAMGGYACAHTKGMPPNAAPGMRVPPPYHHLPAASKTGPLDRLAAETTDIYTRSLNGIVAAAAASAGTGAHRKVGAAVPFGATKMY